MPSSHRRHAELDARAHPARGGRRSGRTPPPWSTSILRSRPHPEQGFRACLGILRLARQYGVDRLEAACRRGLEIGARILRLDQLDPQQRPRSPAAAARIRGTELPLDHPNIRGSRYYH